MIIDFNPVQPVEYWKTLNEWQKNGCKIISCVYDLVYEKYPQYVADPEAVKLLSRWLRHATSKFDGLICISKTVENELQEWIRINRIKNESLRTDFFHLGADFLSKEENGLEDSSDAFFEKTKIIGEYVFLAVSTIEPRKGYAELVESFERAMEFGAKANLVIVGRLGWKYDEIVHKIVNSKYYNKSIFWFSDCDDEILNALYHVSDCFVTSSYYEGFGLGIIEASNRGLPLLMRDIPINREVANDKGLYFETGTDLVDCILRICDDSKVDVNQNKINALTWENSVGMAWNAIKKMIYGHLLQFRNSKLFLRKKNLLVTQKQNTYQCL